MPQLRILDFKKVKQKVKSLAKVIEFDHFLLQKNILNRKEKKLKLYLKVKSLRKVISQEFLYQVNKLNKDFNIKILIKWVILNNLNK